MRAVSLRVILFLFFLSIVYQITEKNSQVKNMLLSHRIETGPDQATKNE